nr:AtzH-like domain-containing protein [Micromonospora matsumotoense]
MCGYFWEFDRTVRFGLADHQYGWDEQRRWRAAQPALPVGRWLVDPLVTTFGPDLAVVTTRFRYAGTGRQTPTWVRLSVGRRIVTAHVSEPTDPPTGSGTPT